MLTLLQTIYALCAFSLGLYTAGQAVYCCGAIGGLAALQVATPALDDLPHVTVQLPLYNEAKVAGPID